MRPRAGPESGLTGAERIRYQRQTALPAWGEEGQERLARATVFVAGAGGLGSAVVLYLAAAGVGCLRICDRGRVELSNLNRQILHSQKTLGAGKARSARAAVGALNRHVRVEPLREPIAEASIAELVGDAQLVLDCLDNLPGRLVLNAYAVKTRLPLVHAGVRAFGGQLTFIEHPVTPCLVCILGAERADSAGGSPPIVGAVAGAVGCLQALEALKHLTGIGASTRGRMLFWDGRTQAFDAVEVQKDPRCPVCA